MLIYKWSGPACQCSVCTLCNFYAPLRNFMHVYVKRFYISMFYDDRGSVLKFMLLLQNMF